MSCEGRFTGRILLADDDVIFRSLCKSKLKTFGLEIVEADDGLDAWHLLKDGRYTLALVDLDMPNMNGVSLIQCIRTHPATRHLPVVMITSREDINSIRLTLQAGATSYLSKPVNWSLFNDHIRHLLTLGQAVAAGPPSEDDGALLAATQALNALYGRELSKLTQNDDVVSERCRALQDLSNLLAKPRCLNFEPIDLRGSLESAAQRGHVDFVLKAPDKTFMGDNEAFMALLSQLISTSALFECRGSERKLVVERRARQLRIGVELSGSVAADKARLAFRLQEVSVLATLNGGELFIDDTEATAGFSFGFSCDRPLEVENSAPGPAAGKVATTV